VRSIFLEAIPTEQVVSSFSARNEEIASPMVENGASFLVALEKAMEQYIMPSNLQRFATQTPALI
jgi:hypothetical protein